MLLVGVCVDFTYPVLEYGEFGREWYRGEVARLTRDVVGCDSTLGGKIRVRSCPRTAGVFMGEYDVKATGPVEWVELSLNCSSPFSLSQDFGPSELRRWSVGRSFMIDRLT